MAFLTGSTPAGSSASDPFLNGLRVEFVFGASTFDIFTVDRVGIDQVSGFPSTDNSTSNLSPAATVITNGTAGSYNDTNKRLTITSTAGLSVGDYLLVAHSSVNGGNAFLVRILSIPVAGSVTFETPDGTNPFDGGGNRTNVSYQVAWRLALTAGNSPTVSSASGTQNYIKHRSSDQASNQAQQEESFWIRNKPSNAITLQSQDAEAGAAGNSTNPVLRVLSAWDNRGGVRTLEWANHSTLSRNDFRWSDNGTDERAFTVAELGSGIPLNLTAGDGVKAGRLLLRARQGSSVYVGLDITYNLDSTAPTLVMAVYGG